MVASLLNKSTPAKPTKADTMIKEATMTILSKVAKIQTEKIDLCEQFIFFRHWHYEALNEKILKTKSKIK